MVRHVLFSLSPSFLASCLLMQHGRVKVKTSEEQEAAKKKEKEEKVRVYREVTGRIYEKVWKKYRNCAASNYHMFLFSVQRGSWTMKH